MTLFLVAQFLLLLMAGLLLLDDGWRGVSGSGTRRSTARGIVYLLAVISGASLLIVIRDGDWLMVAVLLPVTVLSLIRFSLIARHWWTGWRAPVYSCTLLAVGLTISLPMMPYPLDREQVLMELNLIDLPPGRPDSINPQAARPVRA